MTITKTGALHARTFHLGRRLDGDTGSRRTFSRAALFDDDGLKASVATLLTPVTYTNAASDFAGVEAALLKIGKGPARSLVFTLAGAGAFTVSSTITTLGWRGGSVYSEVLTIDSANGGTFRGQQLWDGVTSVAFSSQADTDGTIKIGTGDVAGPDEDGAINGVRLYAAGTLWVRYDEDSDLDDSITYAAERTEFVRASRVLAGSHATHTTSAVACSILF